MLKNYQKLEIKYPKNQ